MIVVIEGPSAVGKTTWCRTHFPQDFVEEAANDIAAPDLYSDPNEVARFWVNFAVQNWRRALELESENGIAICDGDPLHLYFSWALWKTGVLDSKLFALESELYRRTIEEKRLGFADYILWLDAPLAELRVRAKADTTRRRKRHEIYLSLVPWMKSWYAERERLLPGRVRALSGGVRVADLPDTFPLSQRYDARVMDRMLERLQSLEPDHKHHPTCGA